MKHFIAALCLFIPWKDLQADWVSGGGELLRDAHNPWFIQNTDVVNYCVIWDEIAFHSPDGSVRSIEAAIQGAIHYWVEEFQNSFPVGNFVQIATQQFQNIKTIIVRNGVTEETCPQNVDVKFQFGYLAPEQIPYFENEGSSHLHDILGIAVRTEYDLRLLRAKGFIYIAADTGPLRFRSPGALDYPWRNEQILGWALRHELGHVFGLPHKGGVMAPDFLERVVQRNGPFLNHNELNGFFSLERGEIRGGCDSATTLRRSQWERLLQPRSTDRCDRHVLFADRIEISIGPSMADLRLVGTIRLEAIENRTFMWEEAGRIYVTPAGEAVFEDGLPSGAGRFPWILAPMIKNYEVGGVFIHRFTGEVHPAMVRLSPMGLGHAKARYGIGFGDGWVWNLDF